MVTDKEKLARLAACTKFVFWAFASQFQYWWLQASDVNFSDEYKSDLLMP
jgi:hypothetical protein